MKRKRLIEKNSVEDRISPVIIQNIFESLPVGLVVISPTGDIEFTNPATHSILGYEKGLFEGVGWGELFFDIEKNLDFNQVIIDVILRKEVNFHRDVSYQTPSGEIRHLSMTTSLLHQGDELVGLVVLIYNIAEMHQMREREKQILQENHLVQSQRAESLKNLALAVAHQIRNPVVSIGGFAMRMLKKAMGKQPDTTYLESILNGTRRLEDLVEAVRVYADLSPSRFHMVSLPEIVEKVKASLSDTAKTLSKKVRWQCQMQPVKIRTFSGKKKSISADPFS